VPQHPFERPRGRIAIVEVESAALADNLLGDPRVRSVAVYLPEGYDDSVEDYPLMVDLVGYTGSGLAHVGWKSFQESVPQQVDRLVESGAMGRAIFAFPDCFTSLGGNQYINSASLGNWEDFLCVDMIRTLEAEFRVKKGRDHRALFGKSSGGYGAIVHGMRRSDTWAAVACHSGDMDFELCYRGDFPALLRVLAGEEKGISGFVDRLRESRGVSGGDFHHLMMLGMAASYDPDPKAPYGIRLPVTEDTCELIAERWRNWLAWDPVLMVDKRAAQHNLKKLKKVFIDCGARDQYNLVYGARQLNRKLLQLGIEHCYEEFPDNHSGIDYRMDMSLPFLYEAIQ